VARNPLGTGWCARIDRRSTAAGNQQRNHKILFIVAVVSFRHSEDEDGGDALPDESLPKVATEMALHVLAYNLTRVMNIMGIQPLMAAIRM
jgi:hypothetical protein